MAVIGVVDIRKIVDKKTISAGVYSGTVTGFIATFEYEGDLYECHLMTGSIKPHHPCHMVVNGFGEMTVSFVD